MNEIRRQWRKSTRCESSMCVEVAVLDDVVQMRDAAGTVLPLPPSAWTTFLAAVKAGEFDGG